MNCGACRVTRVTCHRRLNLKNLEQPTTRRERRIAARKAQILDAAARVFAKRGLHRATTKEIAEAADVSAGTLQLFRQQG